MFFAPIRSRLRQKALSCVNCNNAVVSRQQTRHRPLSFFPALRTGTCSWRSFSSPSSQDRGPSQHNSDSNITEDFIPEPHMTLQQVHEARQAHERRLAHLKAEERARAHEGLQAQQMEASRRRRAERALATSRMNVAKYSVPYLLSTRSDLFASVMAELNISSTADAAEGMASGHHVDPTSSKADGSPAAQYKGIYIDSIPSFVQQLLDAPETLSIPLSEEPGDTLSSSTARFTGTCSANILLDRLKDAGFGDPQFVKHHRQNRKRRSDYARYLQGVKSKIVVLESRKRKLLVFESNLNSVEKEVEEVENELKKVIQMEKEDIMQAEPAQNVAGTSARAKQVELSPLTSIRDSLTKLLGFGSEASAAEDPKDDDSVIRDEKAEVESSQAGADGSKLSPAQIRLQRRLRKLYRRLDKHEKSVKQGTQAVEGTERQLQKLKKERDTYQPVLSDEQYDTAAALAGDTMKYFCPAFARHLHGRHEQLIERYRILDAQTDLTKPHDWYPRARLDRRKIIYHGGPTNSGKTFNALQHLKEAERGLYLGPLRLLAAEIYEQLTSQGVYCNLFTGQEKKEIPFATHSAATVELAPLDRDFDVVVIDEIQMISDEFRGWAWTRALLGLRCKEIHVAGGLEARKLVERLAAASGDEFELHEYDRFSDLVISEQSLAKTSHEKGSYKAVHPGDAIVAFSRNDIFAIKREIERTTSFKCCVIYGSLPPQIRTQQARQFNDPNSGFDILVASDAIGMGLNLSIRRIIFNSMFKSNGEKIVQLDHSSVKQISGRAGRRNSPYPNGEVTVRDPADLKHLQQCMSTEIRPIAKAGLLPTASHFQLFADSMRKYGTMDGDESFDVNDLYKILLQFNDMARLRGDYVLCRMTQMRLIARWVDDLQLTLPEKYSFCMAPVNETDQRSMKLLKQFASKLAFNGTTGVNRREFFARQPGSLEELSVLCTQFHRLELFLWLCQKFPTTSNMIEEQQATKLKEECISVINDGLSKANKLSLDHCYLRRDRNLRASWAKEKKDGRVDDELHEFIAELDDFDDTLQQYEVDDI